MIQRKQSIYLFLIVILSVILVQFDPSFYKTQDPNTEQVIQVGYSTTTMGAEVVGQNTGMIYLFYAIALLSLITIFLYRNRKLQMKLIMGVIAFGIVVMINMYHYSIGMNYFEQGTTEFTSFAISPVAILLLGILALRGVQKDEKLVRSVDRIR